MPTTRTFGTESAANKAIGGVLTLHYLDFMSRGRGQVVRLMLIDAGATFHDIRYTFDEWSEAKQTAKMLKMNPVGKMPIVEMPNGTVLTQSYAILRHWSRCLDAYDGKTEEEKYWVDAVCDISLDWRTLFIIAFFSDNKEADYKAHTEGTRKIYLDAISQKLLNSDLACRGPFVNGKDITYADLVLYQVMHDEGLVKNGREGLKGYERLMQLVDAVEQRPNVRRFLDSVDYLG